MSTKKDLKYSNNDDPTANLRFMVNGVEFIITGIENVDGQWLYDIKNLSTGARKYGLTEETISKYKEL